jgi:hypothetical protein
MLVVPCNSCGLSLPEWNLASLEVQICPDCGTEQQVRIFPAALGVESPAGSESAAEGEAACFDHPASRATQTCAQCGRFVCQLCAVDLLGNTYCPSCMATGLSQVAGRDISSARVAYDSIALTAALAPLLFFPITLLTGPVAIFLSLRYWKRPLSLTHANRWRFVTAILLGSLEVGGLGSILVYGILRRVAAAS